MHDGRFATLREVIDHYDHGQQFKQPNGVIERINHNTSEEDKLALEAFLRTLTDHVLIGDPRFSDPFQ
jgi:cytochrome c peroxidase